MSEDTPNLAPMVHELARCLADCLGSVEMRIRERDSGPYGPLEYKAIIDAYKDDSDAILEQYWKRYPEKRPTDE